MPLGLALSTASAASEATLILSSAGELDTPWPVNDFGDGRFGGLVPGAGLNDRVGTHAQCWSERCRMRTWGGQVQVACITNS